MGAVVGEVLLEPGLRHQLDRFVEPAAALIQAGAKGGELGGLKPAEADVEPALGRTGCRSR